MKALLVYATGKTEWREDCAGAQGWLLEGLMFERADLATDRNTMFDGSQLAGADGEPNSGTLVYIEQSRARSA